MVITGYTLRASGDLAPDQIIDPAVAMSGDPAILAAHCLERVDPALAGQAREGDILCVAGGLAGGAGAESAVIALQALGVAAVICASADADLAGLAGSYGLPILTQPAAAHAIAPGQVARLQLDRGTIEAPESGQVWSCPPLDSAALAAVRRAQLLARMRRVVEDEGYAE